MDETETFWKPSKLHNLSERYGKHLGERWASIHALETGLRIWTFRHEDSRSSTRDLYTITNTTIAGVI